MKADAAGCREPYPTEASPFTFLYNNCLVSSLVSEDFVRMGGTAEAARDPADEVAAGPHDLLDIFRFAPTIRPRALYAGDGALRRKLGPRQLIARGRYCDNRSASCPRLFSILPYPNFERSSREHHRLQRLVQILFTSNHFPEAHNRTILCGHSARRPCSGFADGAG